MRRERHAQRHNGRCTGTRRRRARAISKRRRDRRLRRRVLFKILRCRPHRADETRRVLEIAPDLLHGITDLFDYRPSLFSGLRSVPVAKSNSVPLNVSSGSQQRFHLREEIEQGGVEHVDPLVRRAIRVRTLWHQPFDVFCHARRTSSSSACICAMRRNCVATSRQH
jgi:hypothetical protein